MPTQGFTQQNYTPSEVSKFRDSPDTHLEYRKGQEMRLNSLFSMFVAESPVQAMLREDLEKQMKEKLATLASNDGSENGVENIWEERLVPKFGVGCRRITPGIGYLESLSKPNVSVIYGGISKITERGVVSESTGEEHELDVLICATGFDTGYKPRFKVYGEDGREMSEEWAKSGEIKAYFGMGVAGYPNYFVVIGPNSPIGNGPVLCGMGE
jgi:cation diffusion facilitator CzcD-associated flavoprotein CzcO